MKAPRPSTGVLLALFKRECQFAVDLFAGNGAKALDSNNNIYFLAAAASHAMPVADRAARYLRHPLAHDLRVGSRFDLMSGVQY
jgi:hypothetical protein